MLNLAALRAFEGNGSYLGVVGFPIAHSLSPVFQNAALQEMALTDDTFRDWEYLKIEAPVEALPEVIRLAQEKGFVGLNLTIPHKVDVLQYLDVIDPVAEKMGAVNTLWFREGRVHGYNTDGYGVATAVRVALGISMKDRPVVIIGAGGAARAACVQCLEEGCSDLLVINRSADRLNELLGRIRLDYPEATIRGAQPSADFPSLSKETLLINATSVGLKPKDPLPMDSSLLEDIGYVYDMVYGLHESRLVSEAKEMGLPAANGLTMLIYQGEKSLSLWTGNNPNIQIMIQSIESVMQGN